MKNSTSIILASVLIFCFATTSYADKENLNTNIVNEPKQRIQQFGTVSAEKALKYSEILLKRSSVARKLKFSDDLGLKARYSKALETLQDASNTYQAGNYAEAKELALESIRIIARSIPRYYNRGDQTEKRLGIKRRE